MPDTRPRAAAVLLAATVAAVAVPLVIAHAAHHPSTPAGQPTAVGSVASPPSTHASTALPSAPPTPTLTRFHLQTRSSTRPAYGPYLDSLKIEVEHQCGISSMLRVHFIVEINTGGAIRDYFDYPVITGRENSKGYAYAQFNGAGRKSPAYNCQADAP